MELRKLMDVGPWDWPEDTRQRITGALRDGQAHMEDRLAAVKLSGCLTMIDDEIAGMLIGIIGNHSEPDDLRETALISLGPGLETAHINDYDLENEDLVDLINDEVPFSMEMYRRIVKTLRELYLSEETPLMMKLSTLLARRSAWREDCRISKMRTIGMTVRMTGVKATTGA